MHNDRKKSSHFFERESDGSARLRIRFSAEEASEIERAAGATPLIPYIHQALNRQTTADIERMKNSQPKVEPT